MNLLTTRIPLLALGALGAVLPPQPANAASQVFSLGELLISAPSSQASDFGDQVASSVDARDMQRFERHTVTDALNLLSGISTSTNARNEGTISLRGFDARQVPIFVDGIPVYVPYDGYVDLDRFTTSDLAAIQVAKGMSSTLYGPNTLGGAINLITRRPDSAFEGDVSLGTGTGGLQRKSVNLGTNQGSWYLQASASQHEADYYRLSDDFHSTVRENGHHRENSDYDDRKQSLKIGLTPNETDEYALGYVRQDGQKGQPPSTDPSATQRYWRWPYWDKESYYFIGNHALSDYETLRLRAYAEHYTNGLDGYTNATYSRLATSGNNPQSLSSTGSSNYDDHVMGGSLQLQTDRLDAHQIKLQYAYKQDRHEEDDGQRTTKRLEDRLTSIALEDYIRLEERWHLALGASRDTLTPVDADTYARPDTQHANNWQTALYFDPTPDHRLYASIARKSRLPTLKDRYSLRFGTFIENPGLAPEHATHYELGYQGQPWAGGHLEAAVFRSDIDDLIQRVRNVQPGRDQMQNINEARHRGAELSLKQRIGESLETGFAYTYLERRNLSSRTRLTDTPRNKLNTWVDYVPIERLHLIAFIEHADQRWSSDTAQVSPFTRIDLKASLDLTHGVSVEAGVNNLSDEDYELSDGYPEPGRQYFTNLRYEF